MFRDISIYVNLEDDECQNPAIATLLAIEYPIRLDGVDVVSTEYRIEKDNAIPAFSPLEDFPHAITPEVTSMTHYNTARRIDS